MRCYVPSFEPARRIRGELRTMRRMRSLGETMERHSAIVDRAVRPVSVTRLPAAGDFVSTGDEPECNSPPLTGCAAPGAHRRATPWDADQWFGTADDCRTEPLEPVPTECIEAVHRRLVRAEIERAIAKGTDVI